jgi:hypothetical protein
MTFEHRPLCRFGPGPYRVVLQDLSRRYCQSQTEVERVYQLVPRDLIRRVQRDAYCLDGLDDVEGDQDTRGVIDADQWLELPREQAMAEFGIQSEADYVRAYRMLEDAVLARDRALVQTGVRASIVVKKPGTRVVDA